MNKITIMKRISQFISAVIFCLLVSLFTFAENTDRQTRNTGSFSSIKVSTGIDLYLEYGSTEKVTVESDRNDLEDLITEVKDGTLHIYLKKKLLNLNFNNSYEVRVTAKKLVSLDASSGAEVKGQNRFQGEGCSITASSGGGACVNASGELHARASSGGDIAYKGSPGTLDVEKSSGGRVSKE